MTPIEIPCSPPIGIDARFDGDRRRGTPGKDARQLLETVLLEAGDDGEAQARGVKIPLSDLLIGVSALELGYRVATSNLRHFRLIPDLAVIQL